MVLPISEQLKGIPVKPGVYQFKDSTGQLLYVGKAKQLKNRVSSYFHQNANHSPRVQMFVEQVAQIEVIVTLSDLEALILEANLIKTLRPKYNILMRDDKKYPWLMFTREAYPRLVVTRDPQVKSKCFGPYASPGAMMETLQLIKTIFPLRQRKKPLFRDRPCMNFHIGTCLGPCQNLISEADYQKMVRQVELFLKGDGDDLLRMIQEDMDAASAALEFERAAMLRDRYLAVQKTLERQSVMAGDPTLEQDVIGMACAKHSAAVAVLKIRAGKLLQTRFFEIDLPEAYSLETIYQTFLFQYYVESAADQIPDIPQALILQYTIEDQGALSEWLSQRRGKKVRVVVPQRAGIKQDILYLACRNADAALERNRLEQESRHQHDPAKALLLLEEKLALPQFPRRMECYDISHVSGTETVASMVVFTDGVPDKSEYRRFKIKSVPDGTPNDFQSMLEVMTRRFSQREVKGWPDPDLVIIDGGKGQLSSAVKALKSLGILDQPIISLAKKFEEVYLPGQARPVVIERNSIALFLLQKIRDEAHRFAITYHRSLRGKSQVASFLDTIPGIGPARKKRLLQAFSSVDAMRSASIEELATALGLQAASAQKIHQALQASHLF